MSFSVKTTHKFLETNPPPFPHNPNPPSEDEKKLMSLFDQTDEKTKSYFGISGLLPNNESKSSENSRLKQGPVTGLAIHALPSAHSDYM